MNIRSLDPARTLGQLVNKMEKVNQKPCRTMFEHVSKKTVQLSLNVFAVALGVSTVAKDIILLAGVILITPVKLEILIVRFFVPGSLQGIQNKLEPIPFPVDQIAHIIVDVLSTAASTAGVAFCLFNGSKWNVAMQKGLFAVPPPSKSAVKNNPQIALKAQNAPKHQPAKVVAMRPASAPTMTPAHVIPQHHAATVQPSRIPALAPQPIINMVPQAATVQPSRIPALAPQPIINMVAQAAAMQPSKISAPASFATQPTINKAAQATAVQPSTITAPASIAPQPTINKVAQAAAMLPSTNASVALQPNPVLQSTQFKIPAPLVASAPIIPPPPFKPAPALAAAVQPVQIAASAIPAAIEGPAAKPPLPLPRSVPAKPMAKMQPLAPLVPVANAPPPPPPPRTYSKVSLDNAVVPVPPPPPKPENSSSSGSDGQFPARSQALLQAIRNNGGVRKKAYETPRKIKIKRTPQSTRSKVLAQRHRVLQSSPPSSPEQENVPAAANSGYPLPSPKRTSPKPRYFSAAKQLNFDEMPSAQAAVPKPPRGFTAEQLHNKKEKLQKQADDGATPRKRTQKKHQGSVLRHFSNLGPSKKQSPQKPWTP